MTEDEGTGRAGSIVTFLVLLLHLLRVLGSSVNPSIPFTASYECPQVSVL